MSTKTLLQQVGDLLDSKLDSQFKKLASKEDVNNLKSYIERLLEENKSLKLCVDKLQEKNKNLEQRIEYLEHIHRKNNLVFIGLNDSNETGRKLISQFCYDNLGIEILPDEIERVIKIKIPNKETYLHRVTFCNNQTVEKILGNSKKLKGTQVYINKDYTFTIRRKRRMLFRCRQEMLQKDNSKKIFIRNDTLFVDNKQYYWDEEAKCLKEKEKTLTLKQGDAGNRLEHTKMEA